MIYDYVWHTLKDAVIITITNSAKIYLQWVFMYYKYKLVLISLML